MEANYNPASKFDLPFDVMCHNCNAITKYADENQTVDETTWGHAGYGERGSGIVTRLMNKKVNKGGQTTIISDSSRFRPRAYIHRHKLHLPIDGMTRRGTNELCYLLTEIEKMILPQDPMNTNANHLFNMMSNNQTTRTPPPATPTTNNTVKRKKIFRRKPVVCADNFFYDDKMCEWIGRHGFGSLGTNARNALPKGIEKKYLHGVKHTSGCKYSKVARFTNPIVAVKECDGYQRVHISFQSTNATNITSVNCFNECKLFVELRERGKGKNKRVWGIEMNDGRRLYLSTYFRIDVADHLLKNAAIFYRTWKYWHAPKNHAFAMIIVLVYDIYLECAEGEINREWMVDEKKRLSFFHFRSSLSQQMLTYSPTNLKYPGDERMRVVTEMPKAKRAGAGSRSRKRLGSVTLAQLKAAKRYNSTRLCGDLDKLCLHVGSKQKIKTGRICAWCGKAGAYTVCGKCVDDNKKPVALHYNSKKGEHGQGSMCFYHYHNDFRFGLGKNDSRTLLNQTKGAWEEPTPEEVDDNRSHVASLSERL